ncbi:MAG TPA: aldehyde ferredoxin oxidoreductase C-terminal domain-containing protein, partial [Spirochaetia bacterium]|nr:aldehyde ferredoxin oxidoreductase C-terminal domain-containing protein [Spirochaetia bacterium]
SPRGGTHTRGAAIEGRFQDIDEATCLKYFGIPSIGGSTEYRNKERLVFFFERLEAFLDCVGICMFTNSLRLDMVAPEDYARLLSAATGADYGLEDILLIGERAHSIEKAFNLLHTDWGREEDLPPKHFLQVPLDGRYLIDLGEWEMMLDRYYELHGWNRQGRPTLESLRTIGLHEVAELVEKSGHGSD